MLGFFGAAHVLPLARHPSHSFKHHPMHLPAGDTPLASLVTSEGRSPLPDPPRPMIVDFRFVSEQQLQANLAAATDPSYRVQDPFVAAFLSFCFGAFNTAHPLRFS